MHSKITDRVNTPDDDTIDVDDDVSGAKTSQLHSRSEAHEFRAPRLDSAEDAVLRITYVEETRCKSQAPDDIAPID